MKTRYSLLPVLVLATLFAVFAPRVTKGASFDFFYDSLDPYGEWFEVPDYGYCWHPSGVDGDWAPYTDGYWAYTDAGWTWVSYEDWGAITYHYGRWVRLNDVGWCWVPGYEWGPAWVSWRSSDDYIGWAPLPPEAVFVNGVGISIWVDSAYGIGPGCYNFCRYRDFGAPALRPCLINRSQNFAIINNTTNITNITVNSRRHMVFNGGPDYRLVKSRSERPVQTLRLVQQTDLNAAKASGNGLFARQHGNQLDVLAPAISRPVGGETPRPKNIGKVIATDSVDKGWSHVSDAQAKQLQARFKKQSGTMTPETTHARPVSENDLRVITENAKASPVSAQPAVTSQGPAAGNESKSVTREKYNSGPQPAVSNPASETVGNPAANATSTPSGKNKHHRDSSQGVTLQPFSSEGAVQSNPGQGAQSNSLKQERSLEKQRQIQQVPASNSQQTPAAQPRDNGKSKSKHDSKYDKNQPQ